MNLITKTRKEKSTKRIQLAFVFLKFRAFVIKMKIPIIVPDKGGQMKKAIISTCLLIVFVFINFLTITVGGESRKQCFAFSESDIPVYQPPANIDKAERRRIGGYAASYRRGLTRELGKSLSSKLSDSLYAKILKKKESQSGKEKKEYPVPDYISPIAPTHVGITAIPTPSLFFYVSSAWHNKLEFRINKEGLAEPIFTTMLEPPTKESIMRIDLADCGVNLEPGVEYEWFVSIITNPDERSADVFGSAVIKYIKPSAPISDYNTYAQSGYFYDAVSVISDIIESGKKQYKKHRAALADQVELPFVAGFDRNI